MKETVCATFTVFQKRPRFLIAIDEEGKQIEQVGADFILEAEEMLGEYRTLDERYLEPYVSVVQNMLRDRVSRRSKQEAAPTEAEE